MPPRRNGSEQPPPLPFSFSSAGGSLPADELAELRDTRYEQPVVQVLVEAHGWITAPAGSRPPAYGAAPPVSHLHPEMELMVGRTAQLLREKPRSGGAEGGSTEEMVALGIAAIGRWLETEQEAYRAAAVALQVALLFMPGQGGLSYYLGRVLRRIGRHDEAEAWLLYAGRGGADAGEYQSAALCCLGNLKRERGKAPEARRHYLASLDVAREHGWRAREGNALYGLAVHAFEVGKVAEGMEYARQAIASYGPGHADLVRLANDIAWIWMHLHGEARLALSLFSEIEPHVQAPPFRGLLLANMARATAELELDTYESAWLDAYGYLASRKDDGRGYAAALGQLALAALAAMQVQRARAVATRCREVAMQRREHGLVFQAERILDATADGEMPDLEAFTALFPGFRIREQRQNASREERDRDFVLDLGTAVGRAHTSAGVEGPVGALVSGR